MATTTARQRTTTARRNHGRSHSYLLDGEKVMAVTEIISKGCPKPALTGWAASEVAKYVADNLARLQGMAPDEIIDLCKGAPFRERDRAANRGTEVHRLARALTEGQEIDVPEELLGHVDSHLAFLRAWQPREGLLELPLYSRRWRYGGTTDWICEIPSYRPGWGMLDLKTNRSGPFGETALQLSAYANAEFYLDAQGQEQPLPRIDWFAVLWLRADGADLYPYEVTEEDFRCFLYCQRIAQWQAERGDSRSMRAVKGEAMAWPAAQAVAQ